MNGRLPLLAVIGALATPAALAAEAPAPVPTPAAGPCEIVRMESLEMETLATGEFSIPTLLNNRPYQLLVDTGSPGTSITDDIAQQLGASTHYSLFGGTFLNGIGTNRFAMLDSIAFGQIRSKAKWQVRIDPESLFLPTVAGLLGADVMANYDIEFDFYGGKMNLFAPISCPNPVYWAPAYSELPIKFDINAHIVVDATLDSKPVKVFIDTGSPSSVMSLDAARDLFGWNVKDPRVKFERTGALNGGAATDYYSYPFATLSFGGVTVQNPKITLIPRKNFLMMERRGEVTIVLGMSVIRQLHMIVSYKGAKLYVTGAEAHR